MKSTTASLTTIGAISLFSIFSPLLASSSALALPGRYQVKPTGKPGAQTEAIYFGTDRVTGKRVVIKGTKSFVVANREAAHLKLLNGVGGAPRLIQRFNAGGKAFVAMENAGTPIQGPLPPGQAKAVGLQLIEAVQAERQAGLHYYDLHPRNVTGEGDQLGLIDQAGAVPTAPQGVWNPHIGTGAASYRAPEQLRSNGWLDRRTLVHQVAQMIYYYYTGERPYQGVDKHDVAGRLRLMKQGQDLSGVPVAVRPVLRRALAFNPRDRFQTLNAFWTALNAAK